MLQLLSLHFKIVSILLSLLGGGIKGINQTRRSNSGLPHRETCKIIYSYIVINVEKINICGYYILCILRDILLLGSHTHTWFFFWGGGSGFFLCVAQGVGSSCITPAGLELLSSCFSLPHAEITWLCRRIHKECLLINAYGYERNEARLDTQRSQCVALAKISCLPHKALWN